MKDAEDLACDPAAPLSRRSGNYAMAQLDRCFRRRDRRFQTFADLRADGLEQSASGDGGCIANSVNYECTGDRNEQGGAATNDRDGEPSTAGGDHYTQ